MGARAPSPENSPLPSAWRCQGSGSAKLVFKNISHFNLPAPLGSLSLSLWATLARPKTCNKSQCPASCGRICGRAKDVEQGGGEPQQLAKPNAPHIVGFFTVPTNNNQNILGPTSRWLPLGIRWLGPGEIAVSPGRIPWKLQVPNANLCGIFRLYKIIFISQRLLNIFFTFLSLFFCAWFSVLDLDADFFNFDLQFPSLAFANSARRLDCHH